MTGPEPTDDPDRPRSAAESPTGSPLSRLDPAVASRAYLRRRQVLAAVLLALSALALWSASRLVWCRVLASDGLAPPRTFDVTGSDWSPWLTPLALVLLAAILAAFSLRGWGLRVIAILVAVAGVLSAIPALSLITGGADSDYASSAADIPGRFQVLLITTVDWAAAVVLVGSLCAVLAGVLLIRVAGGATGMSSKYRTPGARREELERQIFAEHEQRKHHPDGPAAGAAPGADTPSSAEPDPGRNDAPPANERMMWDALDTGIDPTDVDDTPGDRPRDGYRPHRSEDRGDDGSDNAEDRRPDHG
ncbi:TIGR02234 family membrane protein [Gordonia sp. HNM0687]|uniref:TIGR02234 family membrane protein n=1 Tax=Gordonia mangrovi TaxID=2665643 RepID=A0A6L7GP78_9ACTN|nr:TIGR02234 family membrane protein [Gordonia mangrovi]MXP21187.1 TIGR02234 family membrane protein [Gordonia mangrovi]UVF78281.1 TIGR02234 family membrane protein [Gordonia mangrovi]